MTDQLAFVRLLVAESHERHLNMIVIAVSNELHGSTVVHINTAEQGGSVQACIALIHEATKACAELASNLLPEPQPIPPDDGLPSFTIDMNPQPKKDVT